MCSAELVRVRPEVSGFETRPNLTIGNIRNPAARPDEAWVADIIYMKTYEGWLYLAVVMNLFSQKIFGWSM